MRATLDIDGYLAVVPKIQNIYPPEKMETGWQTGFKYDSGVFEYFVRKTKLESKILYCAIKRAIEDYYIEIQDPKNRTAGATG